MTKSLRISQHVDTIAVDIYVEGGWGNSYPKLNAAERYEVVRRLAALAWSDAEIAVRVGIAKRSVQRLRAAMEVPTLLGADGKRLAEAA